MKTHKDLERWKKSIALAVALSRLTKYFPKEELYGVTRQLKCSAVSIPLYIAKGTARNHKSEYIQYLCIALGSHSELDTQWLISKNFTYINDANYNLLGDNFQEIRQILIGFINHLR